jgi:DNA mismatch endonuclease (patch repair protein)
MSRIRSRGNKDTELKLAGLFRQHRIRGWRRNVRLAGKPDFTFRRERLALFVDGCFWHGCPKHGTSPKSNKTYWRAKLARNKARDRQTGRVLRLRGWRVLRIWEHELKTPARVLRRVNRALAKVPLAAPLRIQSNASR